MKNNKDILIGAFVEALQISVGRVTPDLTYNTIPEWDSLGHMALVAELEESFEIMLDTDDIIDMSSVPKAQEILVKYGVEF